MFSHIRLSAAGTLDVHADQKGSARTKGFTHATITLDTNDPPTIRFKDYESLAVPKEVSLVPGAKLFMALVDENGHPCPQSRSIVVPIKDHEGKLPAKVREPSPGVYVFAGTPKSPPRRLDTQPVVEKIRAFLTHPGVETTGRFPDFIEQSVIRQFRLGNRIASLNQQALGRTSPYTEEEIRDFVTRVIVPGVDDFNNSLGRSKDKITYPAGMKRKDTKGDITRFPSYFRIRGFARRLGYIRDEGKPYPAELLDEVERFVNEKREIDYTEINQWKPNSTFLKNVIEEHSVIDLRIVDSEGNATYRPPATMEELERNTVRTAELTTVYKRYQTTLNQRKTNKCNIAEGWPRVKYNDPLEGDWTLEHYGNGQEIKTAALEAGLTGVHLTFGDPLPIEQTAHSHTHVVMGKKTAKQRAGRILMARDSRNARRQLRTVTISYTDDVTEKLLRARAIEETKGLKKKEAAQIIREGIKGATRTFVFVIMQHRPLPADSWVKGFKLVHRRDGSLWLCLSIEKPAPVKTAPSPSGALHLGWRKVEDSIQVATLYDTKTQRYSVVRVNLEKAPGGHVPGEKPGSAAVQSQPGIYEIDMGASRRARRDQRFKRTLFPADEELRQTEFGRALLLSIRLATHRPAEYRSKFHKKAKSEQERNQPYELSYTAIDTHRAVAGLQTLRDIMKDTFKAYMFEHSAPPPWARKAGVEDLHRLGQQSPSPVVQAAYAVWGPIDKQLGEKHRFLWKTLTARLETNYRAVAHAIARKFQEHGITRVAVSEEFLGKLVEQDSKNTPDRIELSQKYRQWMAPAKFVTIFRWTAEKYGIELVKVPSAWTTATCAQCGAINKSSGNRLIQCVTGSCTPYDQDENAALNLSRGGDRFLFGEEVEV